MAIFSKVIGSFPSLTLTLPQVAWARQVTYLVSPLLSWKTTILPYNLSKVTMFFESKTLLGAEGGAGHGGSLHQDDTSAVLPGLYSFIGAE